MGTASISERGKVAALRILTATAGCSYMLLVLIEAALIVETLFSFCSRFTESTVIQ